MRNKFLFFLKLFISFFLLFFLFSKIDLNIFLNHLKNIELFPLIIILLLYAPNIYLATLRWSTILTCYNLEYKIKHLIKLNLICSFLNNFLPTTIGGDVYKFLMVRKENRAKSKEVFSSIILDRGLGFISLLIINLISLILILPKVKANKSIVLIELIFILLFILILLIAFNKSKFIIYLNRIKTKNDFLIKITNVLKTMFLFGKIGVMAKVIFFSFLFIFLGTFSTFLILYALGVNINFVYLLFTFSVVNIFGVLPISLNSLGINEGLYVFLLGHYGVDNEISLAASLIGRIILLFVSSVGGFIFIKKTL